MIWITKMEHNFRKLNIHFDPDALKEAYEFAVNEIGFSGELVNCISLTHCSDESSNPRGIFWTQDADYSEIQVEKYVDEEAYKVFEPLLTNTYFKNIYDVLSKHFRLGRVRVLKLNSRSCLSYHRDPENRLHIPIITNPGALMIVEKEAHHMKADGSVYYMYTQRYHTALNGGDEPRVHLVATILDENPEDELYAIYGGD
tara:strand:+ start:1135 stop:1734 length:600 start_codon:yes stop_codon:yes gene_type:complete